MAEGLGTGLQNHLQRFESASDLHEMRCKCCSASFFLFVFCAFYAVEVESFVGEKNWFSCGIFGVRCLCVVYGALVSESISFCPFVDGNFFE